MRLFSDASCAIGEPLMRRAFILAEQGRGRTSPNPMVGCVVARDGDVVGEGAHEVAGGPHAEVVAVAAAGERARGATVYVTLEPCNHTGRTPPCVPALVEAGISAVVIGMRDPNPGVEGGGADALRVAAIDVRFAENAAPFQEQNEAWRKWVTTHQPWITLKVALTLDGRSVIRRGVRSQLTGTGVTALTHRLRDASDAVVVGATTLRGDDPALTVRDADGRLAGRQPLRVALARAGVPISGARIFNDGVGPALALVGDWVNPLELEALTSSGVAYAIYPQERGFAGPFGVLAARGVLRALVEPGPQLFTALCEDNVPDEMVVYHAGGFAGANAPEQYGLPPAGIERLAKPFAAVEAGVVRGDAVTRWVPRHEDDADAASDNRTGN